jgi:hypothetical protein
MVRQGSRLKTGANYPRMKQYARRAEFFALPLLLRFAAPTPIPR